jgi:glucose-6-phosphate isomerase
MLNTHYFISDSDDGLFERIPLDEIIIDKQDAFSIGQLIYYFELLTSLVGDLLNINTYNQHGVESGKNILMKKLESIK